MNIFVNDSINKQQWKVNFSPSLSRQYTAMEKAFHENCILPADEESVSITYDAARHRDALGVTEFSHHGALLRG